MPPVLAAAKEPLVVIEPDRPVFSLGLTELRDYGELLYFLVWRDIRVQYRQAVLGVLWAVLQPLLLMVIFATLYARVVAIDHGDVPYPLFAYAGFVLWTFFAGAITSAGNSLVNGVNLITKVYFPRMLVPAAAVIASLAHFVVGCSLLVALMLYYGVAPDARVLLLPLVILLTALFGIAVGLWAAALNVKYRDVRLLLPFAAQAWMFVSSVIVPSSVVPARWRPLLRLNPMSAFVESFRATLFGGVIDWTALLAGVAITLLVLITGLVVFRRMERGFADVI